ncbi:LrgB family protein [Alicyclobacillus fastidiosus]|uniref:LrgB family protein n=1 Tax=Alicyclobacillus fastidiosus TaxID=392011 RepID=A0ABV5AGA2_9BACL|nr:LrgB family protein [Alicyclobacillus fastidiosus]WEH08916.1 LrgB family protein [Alicyclobacillus fastidiosus]
MLSLLGIIITVVFYYACKKLYQKVRFVALTPVITCLVLVLAFLLATHIRYATYMGSAKWLTDLLNPTTVALAIPLYRNYHVLKAHIVEFLVSLLSGASVATGSSIVLARMLRLGHTISTSVAPRSVTTPIAMDISQTLGGVPTLTAVFVIITGLCGIVVGPLAIRYLRIRSSVARGALFGMGAHGIGTSRAFELGEMEGTCASLAMVLAAGLTFLLAPVLVPVLSTVK